MPNLSENPFHPEPVKPRKPGVAGLVGDMYGEKAEAAYKKQVSEGKKSRSAPVPEENWEGADITMSPAEQEGMDIERTHVRLQDIPTFAELPAEDAIKEEFNFDWIRKQEYRQDRPLSDCALTDADLVKIGLDEPTRKRILEDMNRAKESHPLAKVFDIGDIIQQKKQADSEHPDHLTTQEVFEALDLAGYRPATLQELLAYGRDYWKPDIDLNDLSEDEQKRLHLANAPYIFALGAPFSGSVGLRGVPYLGWDGSRRELGARDFDRSWYSGNRFLAVRKESS